jgi:hypothetical protein
MKNSNAPRYFRTQMCVLVGLFFSLLLSCAAQDNTVDLSTLTRETQKSIHKEHKLTIVWWIPDDFWRAALAANPDVSAKQTESMIKVVHPYTLVAVVDGEFGPFGSITYVNEKSTRDHLTIFDNNGKEYKPLDNSEVNGDLENLLDGMKPMLGRMLGPLGKNFNFYVFPGTAKNGKMIANPKEESTFTVQNEDQKFKWRLPLGSLLPTKTCSKCSENLSGAFKFCPYDGTALH